jgi:hypothetical protein
MRPSRRASMLAAVVTTSAAIGPVSAAQALANRAPSVNPAPVASSHPSDNSSEVALITLGAAGTITLLGAGVAAARRATTKRATVSVRPR